MAWGYNRRKNRDGIRGLKRGFEIKPGEHVLLVDDILTTGKSIREVIEVVEKARGQLIGIGVMVDRSERELNFGVPLYSCIQSSTVTYPADDCPLCKAGVPLIRMGGNES